MGLLWDTPEERARKETMSTVGGLLGTAPQEQVIAPMGGPDSRLNIQLQQAKEGTGLRADPQSPEAQQDFLFGAQQAGMTPAGAQSLLDPIKQQGEQLRKTMLADYEISKAMTEQSLKQGNVLRKQRDEKLTPFNEAKTQYDTTMNALQQDSGAGTLAAIFSFMKTLDPRSVVREGEFQMGTQTGGVVDSLVGMVNRAQGQGMGPEARRGISETIQAIMEGRVAQAEEIAARFDQIAREQGVPTSQIRTGAYNPDLQGVPEYFNVDIDKSLPSGTKSVGGGVFRLPDGTLVRKK